MTSDAPAIHLDAVHHHLVASLAALDRRHLLDPVVLFLRRRQHRNGVADDLLSPEEKERSLVLRESERRVNELCARR